MGEQMSLPFTDLPSTPLASEITVHVWRTVAGAPQWLFTYAGGVDRAALRAIMQHVRRLTDAVPGDWVIDVVGMELDRRLLRAVRDDLGALRRRGLRPQLARAPRPRPELRAALAAFALASDPPPLLH